MAETIATTRPTRASTARLLAWHSAGAAGVLMSNGQTHPRRRHASRRSAAAGSRSSPAARSTCSRRRASRSRPRSPPREPTRSPSRRSGSPGGRTRPTATRSSPSRSRGGAPRRVAKSRRARPPGAGGRQARLPRDRPHRQPDRDRRPGHRQAHDRAARAARDAAQPVAARRRAGLRAQLLPAPGAAGRPPVAPQPAARPPPVVDGAHRPARLRARAGQGAPPHGWPKKLWPRPKRGLSATLWTTALAADVAYVTLLRQVVGAAAAVGDPARGALARRVGVSFQRRNFGREGNMRRSVGLLAVAAVAVRSRAHRPPRRPAKDTDGGRPRRRGRDGRHARHAGGDRHLAARRQRRRRGRRRGRRARRRGAVLVRHRRRRVHGHPRPRTGNVTTIDHRETAPAAMTPDSFCENGSAARVRSPRATAACRPACPAPRGLGAGARSLRDDLAAQGARSPASASRAAASSSTRCSATRSPATARTSTTSRRPRRSTSTPTGQPRRRRHARSATRTWRATYERIGRLGAERGFYRGPIAAAIVAAAPNPPTADARRRTRGCPG